MSNRRGKLSIEEIEFVKTNAARLSAGDIARHLGRNLKQIERQLGKLGEIKPEKSFEIDASFEETPEWKKLQLEFTEEEIKYFKYKYNIIAKQFKFDIFATEQDQIFMLIKFEILFSRSLQERKKMEQDVVRIDKNLKAAYEKQSFEEMDAIRQAQMMNLENTLGGLRTAVHAKNRETKELADKVSSILKELKGTRDQRVKSFENSNKSYLDLLKSIQEDEFRKKEGEQLAMLKLASKKEMERLSTLHTYADGVVDLPILNADTIEKIEDSDERV